MAKETKPGAHKICAHLGSHEENSIAQMEQYAAAFRNRIRRQNLRSKPTHVMPKLFKDEQRD